MARFSYQARDGRGELGSGVIAAPSVEEASRMLRAEGKFILKLGEATEEAEQADNLSLAQHGRRVKRTDVIFFTHQMAIMIETGVPISDALDSLVDQTANRHFRAVIKDVATHVQGGNGLAAALKKHPHVFPAIMTSLIQASELSGTMGLMLERVSQYMSKEQAIFRQARGAMMYPMFMLAMALVVVVLLLSFVLPRFAAIYANRGAALPAPTRLLLGISHLTTQYWYVWITLALVAIVGGTFTMRTEGGRRVVDWLKLHVPIMRHVFTQLYITRACRTMGTMISAGVSMLDTIAIVGDISANSYYKDLWATVDENLRQGMQLSDPLFRTSLVPRSISQMIRSGEKSGRLGETLGRIAEFTELEFDQTVKTTTQMIEPLMVCVMGTFIGFVAISLLLPIFNVGHVMAGK